MKRVPHLTKRTVDENGDETTQELHFFYEAQSKPVFVEFEGEKYRYVYNLQGDVVGIVDAAGNTVVEYKYDVWGKLIYEAGNRLDTFGVLNPFRYRIYVWDEELELYYLRSRYYSTKHSRFISADSIVVKGLLQTNLFSYCMNKPVSLLDENGKYWVFALLYLTAFAATKGTTYDFSKNALIRDSFTQRIKQSSIVRRRVSEYINQMPKGAKSYTKTEKIYWPVGNSLKRLQVADVDLALAVGHINHFTLTVEKQEKSWMDKVINRGNKYKVTYTIFDHYDFAEWEGTNRHAALIFVNDELGYNLQEAGTLNDYYYKVSGEFYHYQY